jgi:hypothetical protein
MKSTKNVLIAGVALAIALFASIQVAAMEPYQRVNPYLSEQVKKNIENQIQWNEFLADPDHYIDDPKNKLTAAWYILEVEPRYGNDPYHQAIARAILEAYKEIYYGNKPYTNDEIGETLNNARARARFEWDLYS